MADLQVLIAAYGGDAAEKIASLSHPELPGVEYLVSWQNFDTSKIPDSLNQRSDFKIFYEESTGLSNNRNNLLQKASAPVVLISDQDVAYSQKHIKTILDSFEEYPDCDFLAFRYSSSDFPKVYPRTSFQLDSAPKGYFLSSIELALNLKRIKKLGNLSHWQFNPFFGINGKLFGCAEEDVLMANVRNKGYRGRFIPADICLHTGPTTSERKGAAKECIEAKGAAMIFIKPGTWTLRMLIHAWRASRNPSAKTPFFQYCRWWMEGVRKARANKVFAHEKE